MQLMRCPLIKIFLPIKSSAIIIYASFILLGLFFLSISALPVQAQTVTINDDFNTGSLDPAWNKAFIDMKKGERDWVYSLSRGDLVVTDIVDRSVNKKWSTVTLSQTFNPLTDFNVDLDFSWDLTQKKKNIKNAVQNFYVNLYDTNNNLISSVGYNDTSTNKTGKKVATISGGNYSINAFGSSGKESVNIVRQGDSLQMYWNDINILSGTSSGDLGRVDISFSYSKNNNSYFGTESVNSIRVSNVPVVPEPVSTVLFIVGGAVLAGRAYIKRTRKNLS